MFIQKCIAKTVEGQSTLKTEVMRPGLRGTEGQYRR